MDGIAIVTRPVEGPVTVTDTTYDKLQEHRRQFDALPNVLIHDPARAIAYYLPSEELGGFEATPDTWAKLDDTTVAFVIPDGEIVDEVPSFLRAPELRPSVLIRYSRGQSAYFLSFEDLQRYTIEDPPPLDTATSISFVIPKGTELIEELPALRRALLQSHTQ
jgi:hypothetical protein